MDDLPLELDGAELNSTRDGMQRPPRRPCFTQSLI